ncbi:MAG TPA: hypothetical protein VIB47_11320 [Dehalococcoidia bacterium]
MTGLFKLRQGSANQHPEHGGGPRWVQESGRAAFRRYLLASSGISSTALGLALIVSFFATGYGQSAVQQLATADGASVQVVVHGEQLQSHLLEQTAGEVATPEPSPAAVETVVPAAPAPAIDLETRSAPTQQPTAQPTPQPTAPPKRAIVPPGNTPAPVPTATPLSKPVASQPPAAPVKVGRIENVNLTFYDCLDQGFCGTMKYGEEVYEGAAACSWDLPAGTRFRILGDPTKRTYVCEDRGELEDTWVDIFFNDPDDGWDWQEAVGRYGTIEIVSLP